MVFVLFLGDLERHVRVCPKRRPEPCPHCRLELLTNEEQWRHRAKCHPDVEDLVLNCNGGCGFQTIQQADMLAHIDNCPGFLPPQKTTDKAGTGPEIAMETLTKSPSVQYPDDNEDFAAMTVPKNAILETPADNKCRFCGVRCSSLMRLWSHIAYRHAKYVQVLSCHGDCRFVTVHPSHQKEHKEKCTEAQKALKMSEKKRENSEAGGMATKSQPQQLMQQTSAGPLRPGATQIMSSQGKSGTRPNQMVTTDTSVERTEPKPDQGAPVGWTDDTVASLEASDPTSHMWKCSICGAVKKKKAEVWSHVAESHPEEMKVLSCSTKHCSFTTVSLKHLKLHSNSCTEGHLSCTAKACSFKTASEYELRQHTQDCEYLLRECLKLSMREHDEHYVILRKPIPPKNLGMILVHHVYDIYMYK